MLACTELLWSPGCSSCSLYTGHVPYTPGMFPLWCIVNTRYSLPMLGLLARSRVTPSLNSLVGTSNHTYNSSGMGPKTKVAVLLVVPT